MEILALVFTQFLFGALPVTSKVALEISSPLELMLARSSGSALVFLGLTAWRGRSQTRLNFSDHMRMFGLACVGVSFNQFFLFSGLQGTSAVIAAVVVPTIPLFTVLLSTLFRKEAFHGGKLLFSLLGLCGVFVISAPDLFQGQTHSVMSILLIAGSSLLSAAFLVFSRDLIPRLGALRLLVGCYCYGTLLNLVLVLLSQSRMELNSQPLFANWAQGNLLFWLCVSFVVFGSTALSNALNIWCLKKLHASTVSGFVFSQTLIGAILGVVFLNESFGWQDLIAACLISVSLAGLFRFARAEHGAARAKTPSSELVQKSHMKA